MLFLAASLLVLSVPASLLLHPLYVRYCLLAWQQRMMDHGPPPEQVIYDEAPIRAADLLKRAGYAPVTPVQLISPPPADWRPVGYIPPQLVEQESALSAGGGAVAFIGRLRTPAGAERMVDVRASVLTAGAEGRQLVLYGRVLLPASWRPQSRLTPVIHPAALPASQLPSMVTIADRYDQSVRLYAAQRDQADPSHFALCYEINGERDSMDGWLGDDEVIRFRRGSGER